MYKIKFGIMDLTTDGKYLYFQNDFERRIPIKQLCEENQNLVKQRILETRKKGYKSGCNFEGLTIKELTS